tara:strand:- start:890 stop:1063 length:174 start_codon:yes stop_codon:yes gene_type:complete
MRIDPTYVPREQRRRIIRDIGTEENRNNQRDPQQQSDLSKAKAPKKVSDKEGISIYV